MTAIDRKTTGASVSEALRKEITAGRLRPGARLDETRLANRFGDSRTPVREAMLALEREGLIQRQPYKGCRVRSFDDRKLEQIFPLIGALEALAIRSAGPVSATTLDALKTANDDLARENLTPARRYALDRDFHLGLAALAGNPVLEEEFQRLFSLAGRFDAGPQRGLADITGSARQHAAILDALEVGDHDAAARHAEQHWRDGLAVVADWRRKLTSDS
jgi:DNA-binding GntR family transcriptional regulator